MTRRMTRMQAARQQAAHYRRGRDPRTGFLSVANGRHAGGSYLWVIHYEGEARRLFAPLGILDQ